MCDFTAVLLSPHVQQAPSIPANFKWCKPIAVLYRIHSDLTQWWKNCSATKLEQAENCTMCSLQLKNTLSVRRHLISMLKTTGTVHLSWKAFLFWNRDYKTRSSAFTEVQLAKTLYKHTRNPNSNTFQEPGTRISWWDELSISIILISLLPWGFSGLRTAHNQLKVDCTLQKHCQPKCRKQID